MFLYFFNQCKKKKKCYVTVTILRATIEDNSEIPLTLYRKSIVVVVVVIVDDVAWLHHKLRLGKNISLVLRNSLM